MEVVQQSNYDKDNVTTWTENEFDTKVLSKVKTYRSKIESIKHLLMEGKQIAAYQQLQGLSDSLVTLGDIFEQRIEGLNKNASSSD